MIQRPNNFELVRYLYYHVGSDHISHLVDFIDRNEHIMLLLADKAIAFETTSISDAVTEFDKHIDQFIEHTIEDMDEELRYSEKLLCKVILNTLIRAKIGLLHINFMHKTE